jgi:plastocyanin
MTSLRRRISLTLLAAGLSVSVLASANAQEAEESAAGDAEFVEQTDLIVEDSVVDFIAPTVEVTQPVAQVAAPTLAPTAEPTATPAPAPTQAPAAAAVSDKVAVSVIDNRFQPRALTIAPGTTVTWTNNGNNVHTLTSSEAGFDSGGLVGGASFSFKFDKAGTYNLICRQHGLNGMASQVVVQ